ncbi:helix-turn-helix transcriptional regulator [Nonomuraea ferruginea]
MDLVATAVAERVDRLDEVPERARQEALTARVHAFIERHLGDPGLDPAAVAAACHVSPRSLHRVFEARDTTVAGWIRHRRLERCRRDLADPALAGVPVSAVAARCGLPDPAHFSRLFKRAYGVPPSRVPAGEPAVGAHRQGGGAQIQDRGRRDPQTGLMPARTREPPDEDGVRSCSSS